MSNPKENNEELNTILYKLFRLGWENRFANKGELMEIFDNYRIKENLGARLQLNNTANEN